MSNLITNSPKLSFPTDTIISDITKEPKATTPAASNHSLDRKPLSISLSTSNNNQLTLTSTMLDQWFADIEYHSHTKGHDNNGLNDATIASQLLGRFGLRSSQDVILFLNSPAGETIKKIIADHLAELDNLDNMLREQLLEEQWQHNRRLAFLFLGLLHKRAAHTRHLNELIQQQIDAKLHDHEKQLADRPQPQLERQEYLLKQLADFSQSEKMLANLLTNKDIEKELLNRELYAIHKQQQTITQRYDHFEKHLKVLDNVADHETITTRINQLEIQLDTQAEEISQLIMQNKDDDARALMHEHNGLHVQLAGLKDKLAIIKQEKTLYDADGEETDSFERARYILTPQYRLIKTPAGKFALIGVNDDASLLDKAQLAQATIKFERSLPDISNLKHLVSHNRQLEHHHLLQRRQAADLRANNLQQELLLISNQLSQIKAAKASARNELQTIQPDLNKAFSLQNAMPNVAADTAKKIQPSMSPTPKQLLVLKEQIAKLKQQPTLNNINNVIHGFNAVFGANNFMQNNLNRLIPGRPIPLDIMKNLHGYLDKAALSAAIAQQPVDEQNYRPQNRLSRLPTPSPFK